MWVALAGLYGGGCLWVSPYPADGGPTEPPPVLDFGICHPVDNSAVAYTWVAGDESVQWYCVVNGPSPLGYAWLLEAEQQDIGVLSESGEVAFYNLSLTKLQDLDLPPDRREATLSLRICGSGCDVCELTCEDQRIRNWTIRDWD